MKLFSIISLLLLSTFAFSQKEDDDKKGQLGVLAGWNYSGVSASGTSNSNGYYGGVMWEQKVIPSIRLQSGFLFIQNGYSDAGNGHDYTTLNYLTIPIVGKVKVGPVYGLAGITSGFRVGGSNNFNDGSSTDVTSDQVKGYDFGAQLGLGFQLLIFGIEGRYTWGLTDINKLGGSSVNNSAFELGVHVHLF